jgi:hypothetical protein
MRQLCAARPPLPRSVPHNYPSHLQDPGLSVPSLSLPSYEAITARRPLSVRRIRVTGPRAGLVTAGVLVGNAALVTTQLLLKVESMAFTG